MDRKQLGDTNIYTSPIVLGGNVFGWTLNKQESFGILDEASDIGIKTIDTANVYSRWADGNEGGESETLIGEWLKHRHNRNEMIIISKVGSDMGQGRRDLREKHIIKAAEASLRRLQMNTIDLYLTHWDDDLTPVEETLGAYQKLIEAGKVRYIGASNLSPARLRNSLDTSDKKNLARYKVFQPEYNLFDRKGYEEGVADICMKEGLGVITYFSLASGFLTGKYRHADDLGKSVRGKGMDKYMNERGSRILKALDETAEKHRISQAGVALAWLIQSPLVTAPIASATKSSHLRAFTEAIETRLDEGDIDALNTASEYKEN